MAPTVSVIVPVYNTEQYLSECLDSILQQSLADLEVIVVDDASPGGAKSIIEAYRQGDARVKYIRHETNRGLPASRNSGLRASTGRYVYHVDSDDILPSDCLVTLVRAAEEDQVDVVMGHACFQLSPKVRTPAPPLARCNRLRRNISYVEEPALWWGGGVFLFLFRRSFIVHNGLYFVETVSYHEDQVYLARTLPRAERFTIIPHVVYYYRQRDDSMTAARDWPQSRLLEFGRFYRLVAQFRATHKPAVNFFLRRALEWSVPTLIAANKTLERPVFRQMLVDVCDAYSFFDLDEQWQTMPSGYSMPPVPKQFHKLVRYMRSRDLAAVEAELGELSRSVVDERMVGLRRKRLLQLWQDLRVEAGRACADLPTSAPYWFLYGSALDKTGATEDAVAAYKKTIAHDPEREAAVEKLVSLYLKDGRVEEATTVVREAMGRAAGVSGSLHLLMGRCLIAAMRLEAAEAEFRAAMRSATNSFAARIHLAKVLSRLGRLEEAVAVAEDTVQQFPTENACRCYAELITVVERNGRLDQAIAMAMQGIAMAPHDLRLRALHGRLLVKAGDYQRAVEVLT